MILGITGSIGSGKTTAAKIFSKYHFNRIDADEIGHELLKSNKKIKNKIIKAFGKDILDRKKKIDRKKLGDTVFNKNRQVKKLNSIMHPLIISEIKKLIKKNKGKNIIVDAPLLLESKAINLVDKIIVVKCDYRIRIQRLLKKGEYTIKQIKKITQSQMPIKEKLKFADFVIENNSNLKNLEKQVQEIIKKLKNN